MSLLRLLALRRRSRRASFLGGSTGRGRRRRSDRAVLARFIQCENLESRIVMSAGGGTTSAGLLGEYFNNTTLSGTPAFTRTDVRIDFDWGGTASPGGSRSLGFSSLGPTNFSVRWSGSLIPNFSEAYTFTTSSQGGIRLSLQEHDSDNWQQLINDWDGHDAVAVDTATVALTAGQTYDIVVEYFTAGVNAQARLQWSSPSTPLESVDPLGTTGYVFLPWAMPIPTYADAFRTATGSWAPVAPNTQVTLDANGWPMSDASEGLWDGTPHEAGTYLLRFTGKSGVRTGPARYTFQAGSTTYNGDLPPGVGYDPNTNTTTAQLVLPDGVSRLIIGFYNSRRTADSPLNTGITDAQLMRPTSAGASTSYAPGTVFADGVHNALERFTVIRYATGVDRNYESDWSDRVPPTYNTAVPSGMRMPWEDLVALSNELGKDMLVQIPPRATDDYVTNLALLLKYGSDGLNPYSSAQANPVYPPLNPNLRVHVEWANETWNPSFSPYWDGLNLSQAAVQQNTPQGAIINYDGTKSNGDTLRWAAMRTVETSNIFRRVWGDDAMGDRVRILLNYQLGNGNGTGLQQLNFIDNYYNNGDGQTHVVDPHPVSYYIWGGGGAIYYSGSNARGRQDEIAAGDASFEQPALAAGTVQQAPTDTPWTFSGTAGVFSNPAQDSAVGSLTNGTLVTYEAATAALGMSFTVGSSSIALYQLGRWVPPGDNQTHRLYLIRASDRATIATANLNLAGQTAGQFAYAGLALPVILQANTTYYLLSAETLRDAYYDQDSVVTPGAGTGLTFNGSVNASYGANPGNPRAWTYSLGTTGNRSFGPVDFKFATAGTGTMGFVPNAPDGTQALYISGQGSLQQSVNFTTPGVYTLELTVASPETNQNSLDIYLDDQKITPVTYGVQAGTLASFRPSSTPWLPGRDWLQNYRLYSPYNSAAFRIDSPGAHTIKIVGRGGDEQSLYIDQIRFNSVDALFAATIPTFQEQASPTLQQVMNADFSVAQAFGLRAVAYEGGWGVGAPIRATTLGAYAKFMDPRTAAVNSSVLNMLQQAGGEFMCYGSFTPWPEDDIANAVNYPLVQSIDTSNDQPRVDATNGLVLPTTLTMSNTTFRQFVSVGGGLSTGWVNWNLIAPRAGYYWVTMTDPYGGESSLMLDDGTLIGRASGSATISGAIFLTQGLHTIKVREIAGRFSPTVSVVNNDLLPPTSLTALASSSTRVQLSWTNPPGGMGIKIFRATDPDFTENVVLVGFIGAGVSSFTDSGVQFGSRFYYRVCLTNRVMDSVYSNVATVFTPVDGAGVLGLVFEDGTGAGAYSRLSSGLNGWQIDLLDSSGNVVSSQHTSSSALGQGTFGFQGLQPGDYTVRETPLDGWTVTAPASGLTYAVTLTSGSAVSDVAFGNFHDISASGSIYNDVNGDGLRAADEPYLSGQEVTALDSNGSTVATATTDSQGDFVLGPLGPGNFTITVSTPSGWSVTAPAAPGIYTLSTVSGENRSDLDFGVLQRAVFLSMDTTTQGTWTNLGPATGYNIIGASAVAPPFAVVTPSGQSVCTWAASTAEVRALQKTNSGSSDRIAACWYGSQFTVDINLTDGQSHKVSIYALDWDTSARSQRVDVVDAVTGAVLDTRTMSNFRNGVYYTWNLQGHVQLRFTRLSGHNAVLSGLIFGGAAVSYLASDTRTDGDWIGTYGSTGHNVINSSSNFPSYASISARGQLLSTWAASTSDLRGLQKSRTNSNDRIAACWYGAQFTVDVNFSDNLAHTLSIYAVDWDSAGARSQRIDVLDADSGAVLDSRTLRQYQGGIYLTWSVTGHVVLRFTNLSGYNAVVSGIFLDDTPPSSGGTFVSSNSTTGGSWVGAFGSEGYNVINSAVSYPSYATVTATGQSVCTWAPRSSEVRALQKSPTNPSERIAACWYGSQFTVNINLTDGRSHKVSIYALDWDTSARSQRVEVVDAATGAVLDIRTMSNYRNGVYYTWNLQGNVLLRFTRLSGHNAVLSGIFFDA